MEEINVKVKPTVGGDVFAVTCSRGGTILDLKDKVAEACATPIPQIRLIYKGQILKDASTLESYGLNNDHVVHMVKAKAPTAATSPSSAAPTPSTTGPQSSAPAPAANDPLAQQLNALGLGGGDASAQAEQMRAALSSPWVQSLMSNPDVMRNMIQANPALRQMAEANPQVAQILNDPATMQEMMRVMQNPALMREYTRNMDRSLANIESMPGGFNALRQVHEQIQEPLYGAAADAASSASAGAPAAGSGAANPFAALFQQGGSPAAAGSPGTGTAPNSAPLPNPWAPAAPAGGAGAAAGAGMGAFPGLGGLGGFPGMPGAPGAGGMDASQMAGLMGTPEMQEVTRQMMQDPAMRRMMASQMRAMVESDPTLRQATAGNPAMQAALSNPETMESMLAAMSDPAQMAAMQQMSQAAAQLQGGPLASMFGMPGMPGAGADFGGPFGGAFGAGLGAPPAPPANAESAYSSQLQQLHDMGFFDRDSNLRALVATGGNVHAAVDRLLQSL